MTPLDLVRLTPTRFNGTQITRITYGTRFGGPRARRISEVLACPFHLAHPGVRRTGCGRSSGAPGLRSEGDTRVDPRIPSGVTDARRRGRPRRTALTGRPTTSA
jgi:hypothetical protein